MTTSWVLSYLDRTASRPSCAELDRIGRDRDLSWVSLESPGAATALDGPPDLAGVDGSVLGWCGWRPGCGSDAVLARLPPARLLAAAGSEAFRSALRGYSPGPGTAGLEEDVMGMGIGIALLVVGAILSFAVRDSDLRGRPVDDRLHLHGRRRAGAHPVRWSLNAQATNTKHTVVEHRDDNV